MNLVDNYQSNSGYKYPYYFDAVISEAISKYGLTETEIMSKGLKIYTSLDQNYQKSMESSFKNKYNFPSNPSGSARAQGASVAMDPKTGAIKALVGGRGKHVFRGYNRRPRCGASQGVPSSPWRFTPRLLRMATTMIQACLTRSRLLAK